jgi:lipopolysaccharide heptosyltransferase II
MKILVLRLSSLGDVVLSSSFLRSLRTAFPDACIEFVVREDLEPVAQLLPHVTTVHPVPRDARWTTLLQRARDLARRRYAHVFDLHQSLRSRILCAAMPSRLRRGFHKQSLARWLLIHLHRDHYGALGGSQSLRLRMLQPLQRLGVPVTLQPTRLCIPDRERQAAERRLRHTDGDATRQWVAMAPGALWPAKQWPAERFVAVGQQLLRDKRRSLLLVGGEREGQLCEQIAASFPERCMTVAGHTSISETAALLAQCEVTVTNDSGLLHIAEAVGSSVVALFGPTSPRFGYGPSLAHSRLLYRPPACSPCSKNGARPCQRPTHECMLAISTDEVVEHCEDVLRTAARQGDHA